MSVADLTVNQAQVHPSVREPANCLYVQTLLLVSGDFYFRFGVCKV